MMIKEKEWYFLLVHYKCNLFHKFFIKYRTVHEPHPMPPTSFSFFFVSCTQFCVYVSV